MYWLTHKCSITCKTSHVQVHKYFHHFYIMLHTMKSVKCVQHGTEFQTYNSHTHVLKFQCQRSIEQVLAQYDPITIQPSDHARNNIGNVMYHWTSTEICKYRTNYTQQTCSTLRTVLKLLYGLGNFSKICCVFVGNMKFNEQNEEWISICYLS
jgi:hypothetical protein